MDPDLKVQSETSNSTVVIPQSKATKPENPSQYIRTFAKDVARLSGQPAPEISASSPQEKQPIAYSLPIGTHLPNTQQNSPAFAGESREEAAEKPVEVLVTSKEDERGIFETGAKNSSPAVVPPAVAEVPTPPPGPTLAQSVEAHVVSETILPNAKVLGTSPSTFGAPTDSDGREGILARLRAKINTVQTPGPLEKRGDEMNLLQSQANLGKELPSIPTRENVAPSMEPFEFPAMPAQPVVSEQPEPKPFEFPITLPQPVAKVETPPARSPEASVAPAPPAPTSPLHTYSSDFADRIDERSANAFSVLAAEQDAAPMRKTITTKTESTSSGKWRLALAGVLLVVGIGAVITAFVYFANSSSLPISTSTVPSLLSYDSTAEITDTGTGYMTALAQKANEPLPQGNVLVTYISLSTTTSLGVITVPQPGGLLIAKLGTNAPEIFLRNASPESTVGVIAAGNENKAFFIFKVTSYERTFAGMLTWESSITRDLALLYPPYATPQPETTVGISTTSSGNGLTGFVDAVVANHDVREYKDSNNRTVLMYGYKDKETLVIARDEAAFSALIARLSSGVQK